MLVLCIHFYDICHFCTNNKLIENMVFYKNIVCDYLVLKRINTIQLIKKADMDNLEIVVISLLKSGKAFAPQNKRYVHTS